MAEAESTDTSKGVFPKDRIPDPMKTKEAPPETEQPTTKDTKPELVKPLKKRTRAPRKAAPKTDTPTRDRKRPRPVVITGPSVTIGKKAYGGGTMQTSFDSKGPFPSEDKVRKILSGAYMDLMNLMVNGK
jgi:hypothetical protein